MGDPGEASETVVPLRTPELFFCRDKIRKDSIDFLRVRL